MPFNDPPWIPLTDPRKIKILSKLTEEMSELIKVISRVHAQGIEGIDPATGEINKRDMENEMADSYAMMSICMDEFNLEINHSRVERKAALQLNWMNSI